MAADAEADANPAEQLLELFLYAPIGLLYEYPDVLPKLIKRGKSQVQLARVLGQMAVKQQGGLNGAVDEVASSAISLLARGVTEFGAMVGLAPEDWSSRPSSSEPDTDTDTGPTTNAEAQTAPSKPDDAPKAQPLPIAGYDDLTAREIVPLLDDLTADQRQRIRAHEQAGRSRKTVLGKLDRLES